MKTQKIKNPLRRRILRELLGDWKKYLVVSLFLILTIGFVSGMYVANESMMTASNNGIVEYKLEHGHFELKSKADAKLLEAIAHGDKADAQEKYELNDLDFRSVPVTVYENFYHNEDEDNNNDGTIDGTVRVYKKTDNINLGCVLDGRLPQTENEIAIDRMHADNVGVQVGEKITVGEKEWNVVGLIAYVNYSTLHEKSTDFMFDALTFDVAMVTEEGFARFETPIHYAYAWQYVNVAADEKEEKNCRMIL